jgi:endonuclease/exonuclease/phosphatase (EEP) superfamily protein YafD
MTQILFWNVKKKNLTSLVCAISSSTDADIVVLLESSVSPEETLKVLKENVTQDFYYPKSIQDEPRFHCFCRNSELDLSEIHCDSRTSVRILQIGQHKTLLILVHGVDVRNYDPETRQSRIQRLATQIRFLQEDKKITKSIFLGDFNMNPFEKGMNLPDGLNAMMTKECTKRGYRISDDNVYDFYYNPMWSLFGDNTGGPAGTIYNTSNQGIYGWSMFDQVIIHHSVVDLFDNVKILTEAGTESLMNKQGRPDAINASDHFPILVNFSRGE